MKRSIYILTILCFISCQKKEIKQQLVINYDAKKMSTENGVLLYNSKPFSGVLKIFDAVNQTKNSTPYLNGKKEGEELKIYTNDILAEQRFYKRGVKVGIHKAWWENGTSKFEYPFNDKGFYNGEIKEWYRNGQLVKVFHYKNGKEKGSQKMWQSNGNIRANYIVVNGERFGLIGLKKCYTIKIKDEKK